MQIISHLSLGARDIANDLRDMLKAVVDQDRLKNQQSFVLPHVMVSFAVLSFSFFFFLSTALVCSHKVLTLQQGAFPALPGRTSSECAARFKLVWNLNKVFADFMSCVLLALFIFLFFFFVFLFSISHACPCS